MPGKDSYAERLLFLERLLESSRDAIVGTDTNARITLWNSAAERMYGYPAAQAVGRRVSELRRKDWPPADIETSRSAVRDDQGSVVGHIAFHRDVTGPRKAEREKRQLASIVENSSDFIGIADLQGRAIFVNDAGRRLVELGDVEVASTHVLDYFAPEERDLVRDELLPLILEKGRWPTDMELTLRNWATGDRIPVLCDAFRIDDPLTGEPIAIATVTGNLGERGDVAHQLEIRARQQAVVAALGVRALTDGGVQEVMDAAVAGVAHTLGVELAAVTEPLPGGERLLFRAGVGWEEGAIGHATDARGTGSLVGHVLASGEPLRSDDIRADERFELSPLVARHNAVSAVSVVIAGRDYPVGVLAAFSTVQRIFSTDDVNFMQAVANVVSAAHETAVTDARLDNAREGERRRIARDLHDDALQQISDALAGSGRQPDERTDELLTVLRAIGRQLRGAIYDLRLEDEAGSTFADRLRSLAAVQAALTDGADLELEIAPGTPPLLDRRGTEVLRIVGEAVTNARRHSGAAEIRIHASGTDELLRIHVSDDGRGFDPATGRTFTHRAGLAGIRERAELIGAELWVESAPGAGTVMRLELQLDDGRPRQPMRILLVDDHAAVRQALAATFRQERGFRVVGQAGSLAEARGVLEGVDVAVVDLGLPDGSGADLISDLRRASPRVDVLVLTASVDRASVAGAVHAGAAGAIGKSAGLHEVVDAVRRLRAGEALLPPAEVAELLRFERTRQEEERNDRLAVGSLTPREGDVMQALADGLDSGGVARRLHITPRTERNHVANVLAKLGVHSRLQALVMCLRYGLVEIHEA